MGLKQKIDLFAYRMKLRVALQKSSKDELEICLDEVRKEINRRNKKK